MNRKGFTLIELILVIVILSMILLVLMPNVITIVNKNKTNSCHSLEENIISSAKTYVANNKYELGFSCNEEKSITIEDLIDSGDLKADGEIINPFTDTVIEETIVKVTYDCTSKAFSYDFSLNCE